MISTPMPFTRVAGLSKAVSNVFDSALKGGEIIYADSALHFVDDAGIRFRILVVSGLEKKSEQAPSDFVRRKKDLDKSGGARPDPFMPYEKNLYVGEIGSYNLILNKYPVIRNHFLLTTKAWDAQEYPLNREDFKVIFSVMASIDDHFCLYNCGDESGASVLHKHIQLIPNRGTIQGEPLPIYRLLEDHKNMSFNKEHQDIFKCNKLPFLHYLSRVPEYRSCENDEQCEAIVKESFEKYKNCLNSCIKEAGLAGEGAKTKLSEDGIILKPDGTSFSHNFLLMPDDWMLVVVRSSGVVEGLGFNSIAFTGEILVKNQRQLETVMRIKPLKLLSRACYPDLSRPAPEAAGP